MIFAGFTMNGDYDGKKEIYGDDTGLLLKPALFNRKKENIFHLKFYLFFIKINFF